MWKYDDSYNELYHYGIPGMKWGVRKIRQIKEAYQTRKVQKRKEAEEKLDAKLKSRTEELNYKSRMYDKKQQLAGTNKDINTLNNPFAKANQKMRAQLRAKMSAEEYAEIQKTFDKPAKRDGNFKKFLNNVAYKTGQGIAEGSQNAFRDLSTAVFKKGVTDFLKNKMGIDISGEKKYDTEQLNVGGNKYTYYKKPKNKYEEQSNKVSDAEVAYKTAKARFEEIRNNSGNKGKKGQAPPPKSWYDKDRQRELIRAEEAKNRLMKEYQKEIEKLTLMRGGN